MRPLYDIISEFKTIIDELYSLDEITPDNIRMLEEIKSNFEDKVISIASFIKNLESEHDSVDKALNAMRERRDKLSDKIEKLKEYLRYNMSIVDIDTVKCDNFEVKLRKNPCSVDIRDEKDIPEEYIINTVISKIDRQKILYHLKNGVIIPGVSMQSKTRVDIR